MLHVAYAGRFTDDSFREAVAASGPVALAEVPPGEGTPGWRAALGPAEFYQVTSARDDVGPELHAGEALLAAAPRLLAVSTGGAGYDTVDVPACTRAGVLAVNQTGGNEEAVAEHALAMILSLSKRIGEVDRALRAGGGRDRYAFKGHDIHGRTLGIVGFGRIGRRLAAISRVFAMPVLAFDPYLTADDVERHGARKVEFDELLRGADIVSLHCPLSAETRGLIGGREFAAMRPGALFVTTARGGIHDEAALAEALASGRLAGAGLDVWTREPPAADHPLLRLPNVIATPHTAGGTHEARRALAAMAAEQVLTIAGGRRPPRLLNPEAWPAFAERFARILGRPALG